jgi:hypothetical protein
MERKTNNSPMTQLSLFAFSEPEKKSDAKLIAINSRRTLFIPEEALTHSQIDLLVDNFTLIAKKYFEIIRHEKDASISLNDEIKEAFKKAAEDMKELLFYKNLVKMKVINSDYIYFIRDQMCFYLSVAIE